LGRGREEGGGPYQVAVTLNGKRECDAPPRDSDSNEGGGRTQSRTIGGQGINFEKPVLQLKDEKQYLFPQSKCRNEHVGEEVEMGRKRL